KHNLKKTHTHTLSDTHIQQTRTHTHTLKQTQLRRMICTTVFSSLAGSNVFTFAAVNYACHALADHSIIQQPRHPGDRFNPQSFAPASLPQQVRKAVPDQEVSGGILIA